MHDYILIQFTQLFCKAVASYLSCGVWVSWYHPLLFCHSPLRHPRYGTAMVTSIKTLDWDGSLRTQKRSSAAKGRISLGTHYPSRHLR